MNFQQLEYIIAVGRERHFARAAKSCFVTQPTLSMMIQKLEEELGVLIFDREKHPIEPTKMGKVIIEEAKIILNRREHLLHMVSNERKGVEGKVIIGVIPTIAPYLLPRFINSFIDKYPKVQLQIEEINTETIVQRLKEEKLDIGILATPLEEKNIEEYPLYYERFYVYGSGVGQKGYVLPEEIDSNRLLLLEEGHCLSTQIMNICALRQKEENHLLYRIGSLETLIRLVEKNRGITLLPELAVLDLASNHQKSVSSFKAPEPVREISIVTHKSFIKEKLRLILQEEILANLPNSILENKSQNLVQVK